MNSKFECPCNNKKNHKLILDGGPIGNYELLICQSCYLSLSKKFLVGEDVL